MKLYTFEVAGQRRAGAEQDGHLVDLRVAYDALAGFEAPKSGGLRAIPAEMSGIIRLGALAHNAAREALACVKKRPAVPAGEQLLYPFEAVRVLAPLPRPGKILCARPEEAVHHKLAGLVSGPGEAIAKPGTVEHIGFELGIAAVIGTRMKAISESEALDGVFGLTILADLFAADDFWVRRNPLLARNFDTFCPMGPCITTIDELNLGTPLDVRVEINGKRVQESKLEWTHPVSSLIAEITEVMTLEPGDVVCFNAAENKDAASGVAVQLNPGGSIVLEVEQIGRLECPIIAR